MLGTYTSDSETASGLIHEPAVWRASFEASVEPYGIVLLPEEQPATAAATVMTIARAAYFMVRSLSCGLRWRGRPAYQAGTSKRSKIAE